MLSYALSKKTKKKKKITGLTKVKYCKFYDFFKFRNKVPAESTSTKINFCFNLTIW